MKNEPNTFYTCTATVFGEGYYTAKRVQLTHPTRIRNKLCKHISKQNSVYLMNRIYRVRLNYLSILQNLVTDASSVTKLFIPSSD
jgi:hypothetical protein